MQLPVHRAPSYTDLLLLDLGDYINSSLLGRHNILMHFNALSSANLWICGEGGDYWIIFWKCEQYCQLFHFQLPVWPHCPQITLFLYLHSNMRKTSKKALCLQMKKDFITHFEPQIPNGVSRAGNFFTHQLDKFWPMWMSHCHMCSIFLRRKLHTG